ncbi:MAG TPA: radical SAM protein [Cryptosporangiaceae bacterium]|nr:radical SAM protein [Cryptosporangiaceae bacterium]
MVSRVVLDLVERIGALPVRGTADIALGPGDESTVAAWCARTGNELVAVHDAVAVVRRGRPLDDLDDVPAGQRPGARLWMYTNFDCNLACDYCCSASSPQAARKALGLDRIRQVVAEAADAGVSELYLTGGEPFLLTDLDEIVAVCVAALPTTLLTNGMLFRGSRLAMLRRMPRALTLQISLDSPTPLLHDRHRGAGSWQRARDGIQSALAEGFRVRVAATIAPAEPFSAEDFHAFLDGLGIPRADQVIRPIAQQGFADDGLQLTVETLLPEVTVTADGVYWHPVGAVNTQQLVTTDIFPLDKAIAEVHARFTEYRRTAAHAAERFPCA